MKAQFKAVKIRRSLTSRLSWTKKATVGKEIMLKEDYPTVKNASTRAIYRRMDQLQHVHIFHGLNLLLRLDDCLINASGKTGNFMPDDRFGETIITLNKEKVRRSANAKTDEFYREVIGSNVISLWRSKEVLSRVVGATRQGSHHALVKTQGFQSRKGC